MSKFQVPTIGGIRKVIHAGPVVPVGTTIAELGAGTISLAQLAAILTKIQTSQQTGGGNIGPTGAGGATGATGARGASGQMMFGEDGADGEMGPPGPPGPTGSGGGNGITYAQASAITSMRI
jgi:hypothetical protein